MIAKASAITHGSNAVRYSADKDLAEIVKVGHLPEDLTTSAIWARMMLLQQQYRHKLKGHHGIRNTSLRIELSPAKEETEGWTMADWEKLADDFIREFDAVSLKRPGREDDDPHMHLANSQYVVSLHRDSKSGILHLYINANRIDMDGNTNNEYMTGKRATEAANKINEQRGWVQSMTKRDWNIDEVTNACIEALKSMDCFDWKTYEAKLTAKGYGVKIKRDAKDKVVGYSVKKGNSTYKSSVLGHMRNLTPSRIEDIWAKLHQDKNMHTQEYSLFGGFDEPSTTRVSLQEQSKEVQMRWEEAHKRRAAQKVGVKEEATKKLEPVRQEPVMVHHDIEINDWHYPVSIPEDVNRALLDAVRMSDDGILSKLVDVQDTAILLFANYLDAATQLSEYSGGGGSAPESGWGRKEDEDDIEWARRCAQQARIMHARPIRRMHR